MLFDAKLDAIQQHLLYIRRTLEDILVGAYPNLAGRLRISLSFVEYLERETAELAALYAAYRPDPNPARDVWPQLVSKLQAIDGQSMWLRTRELPAYLDASPHVGTYSRVIEGLYREVGVTDMHPVVSLHQPGWFAVLADYPGYPLFLAPESVLTDPGELPLVFHEMGHTFFRFFDWSQELRARVAQVVDNTVSRKQRESGSMPDQAVRQAHREALTKWQPLAKGQVEELVCDITGTLLGGPAFTAALTIGLLATAPNPFNYSQDKYPPLDCRMRVGGIVLRRLGLDDGTLDAVESGWARVSSPYISSRPVRYTWLYDDAFLNDVAAEVETFLVAQGVQPYREGDAGLRGRLAEGARLRPSDLAEYRAWARDISKEILQNYSS